MARRRVVDRTAEDAAAQQLTWARYLARVADLGGFGRSDLLGERYMSLSADDLAVLAERRSGHPASRQVEKHLALAAEAASPADEEDSGEAP